MVLFCFGFSEADLCFMHSSKTPCMFKENSLPDMHISTIPNKKKEKKKKASSQV